MLALGPAGCLSNQQAGSTTTALGVMPNVHLTAVQESESWFKALNAHNRAASLAHFAPGHRSMADWNGGDVSQWPTFTNVSCSMVTGPIARGTVHCTFKSHGDPSSAGDTFWNVEGNRTAGGPWLITNYGQG